MYPGGWWHAEPESGRIHCDLCPRACSLKAGDRGFCFVRQNVDGEMMLTTFGKSTGFCIDPIEKKPLNHFYPGTSVLSFGTAGCNLGCKFCQNWDISKSREVERLSEHALPEAIAEAARQHGCTSVAFTYNDPIVWAEYAIETARACRAVGIKTVAVTAGYICPEARGPFYEWMDAANVDLKGFTEDFYHHVTYSHLQPVLDTLAWLKAETDVWFEITNLVIPGANDSADEIRKMSGWILQHCGDEVPVHFTAFHPDFRMRDRGPTPHEKLVEAHDIAKAEGIRHVYTGNVDDRVRQSTYCLHCRRLVIERNWYELGAYHLNGNRCAHCGGTVAGRFGERPGTWGRRRQPVAIAQFAPAPDVVNITFAKDRTMNRPPEPAPAVTLSAEQRGAILKAAAEYVASAVIGRPSRLDDPTLEGAADLPAAGAYVTLKRQGQLRACVGTLGTARPLLQVLRQASYATAKEDFRLPPISPSELAYFSLDVNILFNLTTVAAKGPARIDAIEVGRHGLRIQRGEAGGLLLPSVATEHGWDSETFLRHICRKAGLPSTAWEDDDAVLATFESVEFGGPFPEEGLPRGHGGIFTPQELEQSVKAARQNIHAILHGMTPSYYVPGVPDGNVAGVDLMLTIPGVTEPLHVTQLALRPGVPFQSTLFRLSEAAAKAIGQRGGTSAGMQVGLTVLSDPAMHGTVAEPDLRGLDPAHRALLAVENDKNAWVYAPSRTAEELLATAKERFPSLDPARVALYGLGAQSTEREVIFTSAPVPVAFAGIRHSTQAGRFYPAEPEKLARLVDELLAKSPRRPERWPAAMLPHAGLVYSGSVAASVLNRLEIPETVIILGPKHTRLGVDWAVVPHSHWAMPGGVLASDPALAQALVEAIPGLQADASAHAQEHAIEVELPLIHRLAPNTKVVGIALGGGGWELCQKFATGLATVLRALPKPPLLLISSDMNHFATDRENRLLDERALVAMETLDARHLLQTVSEHDISMCGVLPAAIVMETLRQLGGLQTCERVAYATSADVSGDTSRVVGYAGVLLG